MEQKIITKKTKKDSAEVSGFCFNGHQITPVSHPCIFQAVNMIERCLREKEQCSKSFAKVFKGVNYDQVSNWCLECINYFAHFYSVKNEAVPVDVIGFLTYFCQYIKESDFDNPETKGVQVIKWLFYSDEDKRILLQKISNVFFACITEEGGYGGEEVEYFAPVFNKMVRAMLPYTESESNRKLVEVYEKEIRRDLRPLKVSNGFEKVVINDRIKLSL